MSSRTPHPPSPTKRLRITISLQEDTHLGSGASGAGLNALIARDREGMPVIWASHLEGLLREQAMLSDPAGKDAYRLFGERGGARQPVTFSSLYCRYLPGDLRVWRSAARKSFDNRAPADNSLRAVQMVPQEAIFVGEAELPEEHEEMLRRYLFQLTSIGQGRATGAGKISIKVEGISPPAVPFALEQGTTRLRLMLVARDPVCVAATAIPGNLIPTASYLPGRTVLGAIANWLITSGHQDIASLLVTGELSVSDALPLPDNLSSTIPSELEVLPAPLAIKTVKRGRSDQLAPWWAYREAPSPLCVASDHREPGDNEPRLENTKLKRLSGDTYFARAQEGTWSSHCPVIRARLRSGRPDPAQRHPSLFAIQHIAENTHFLLELQGPAPALSALCESLRPVLEARAWLRVGRAGAPVEVRAISPYSPARVEIPDNQALLTLTSDLLVRDETLRWFTELNAEDFRHVANWPTDAIKVERFSQEGTTVRGFNGTARLWRLPIGGVRRGSVFRVSGQGVAALASAAQEGRWLGERCHEGFGRFRLDARKDKGDKKALLGLSYVPESAPQDAPLLDGGAEAIEERYCVEAREWLSDHLRLKEPRDDRDPTPSLSQWMELATDLEAGGEKAAKAIERRRHIETAGGRGWLHADAQEVMALLDLSTDLKEKAIRARLFVRWLRVELRTTTQESSCPTS